MKKDCKKVNLFSATFMSPALYVRSQEFVLFVPVAHYSRGNAPGRQSIDKGLQMVLGKSFSTKE